MKTKSIRQSVTFRVSPHEVYEALMSSRKHARFTGSKASISRRIRGEIEAYDGYIKGMNLELVPDQRIVQTWFANDRCWPKNHYSKVTISLKKVRAGTHVSFFHSSVPEKCYKSIRQGWWDAYWTPMKKMFGEQKLS
jgi:activator of HSP90 ATPase